MKKAYSIDEDGFYIEDYLYENEQQLETNTITTDIQQGLYKPKWNGSEWVEGATQEYIDSLKQVTTVIPTVEDRLKDIEIALAEMLGGVS